MKKMLIITACITILILCYTNEIVYAAEEGVAGISTVLDKIDTNSIKQYIDIIYKYTTDRVNLRSEASTKSSIITTLDKRVKVHLISSSNGWSKVKYDTYEGYIYSKYLRDTELPRW